MCTVPHLTQAHKAVGLAHNAHFPLLNYICTSARTCKHTSDSCLLSRMLNCPQFSSVKTDCTLCETYPNTRPSPLWGRSCKSLTRPLHSPFSRSIQASSCPRATTIHLCTVWCEKKARWSSLWNSVDLYFYRSPEGTCEAGLFFK